MNFDMINNSEYYIMNCIHNAISMDLETALRIDPLRIGLKLRVNCLYTKEGICEIL